MHRKLFSRCALPMLMALTSLGSSAADADDYPSRPITVLYPTAPGGTGDTITRYVMERVSKILGQPVVIENKAGGNLTIAGRALLAAKPDGYTLLSTINGQITAKALMELPYDPLKDFTPVGKMVTGYFFLAVNAKLPVNNFREFVEYAKTHQVSHGAWAPSSLGNVFAETVNMKLGTRIVTAMYRGEGQIVTDMIGGTLDACFCTVQATLQHAKAGKLKVIGYTGPSRSPLFPDVQTFAEQGYVGAPYDYGAWVGVLASAKTPPERIKKFAAAMQTVMKQTDVIEYAQAGHMTIEYQGPAQFQNDLTRSYGAWETAVRAANIQLK